MSSTAGRSSSPTLGPTSRATSPDLTNPEEAAATVAILKRRLASVSDKLDEALQPKSKRIMYVLQPARRYTF